MTKTTKYAEKLAEPYDLLQAAHLGDQTELTQRQATAFILRDIAGISRDRAAEQMSIEKSTLDTHLSAARSKIESARNLVDEVERLDGSSEG